MACHNLPTFLSKHVQRILVDIGEPHIKKQSSTYMYTKPNFTFQWKKIESILSVSECFVIHNQNSTWFVDKIDKLWPIFVEAHSLLTDSSRNLDGIQKMCNWTSHPNEIQEYLHVFCNSGVSNTEAVLFLTAVLERSLGNLFLLHGSCVPSLLRDLLSTSEIQLILGQVPVVFLQILLGTPLALNLRNVAWHGFPREDQLYSQFVSTLFMVIMSIGEILCENEVDFHTITRRPQVEYSDQIFNDTFPNVQKYHKEILQLLGDSDYIPSSHSSHWENALGHYVSLRHGRTLLLLLPLMEHMLRCLYCCVNECSERALTAESVSSYITLNEIMSKNLINENGLIEENKLFHYLGQQVFDMLQDIYFHPSGPRIRDKMSHGECIIKEIPGQLVNHMICVILVIEMKSKEYNKTNKEENKSASELINHIAVACEGYESKYHISSLLKMSIRSCLSGLSKWSWCMSRDFDNEIEINNTFNERNELSSLIEQTYSHLQENASFLVQNKFSISAHVDSLKVQTMFRHKTENKVLKLLMQIMSNVDLTCACVSDCLMIKEHSFSDHLLRSRQRLTFQRMLSVIPQLKDILMLTIIIVVLYLQSVNNVCNLSTKEFEKLTKFCQAILKFAQNMASLTHHDKNRWLEIRILCEKYCCNILDKLDSSCLL